MLKLLSSAFGVFLVSLVVFAYVGEKNQDMIMTKLGNYFKSDGEDIQEFIKNMREDNAKSEERFKFDESKYTSEEVSYFNEIVYDGIDGGKPKHSNHVIKYTEDVKIYVEGDQPLYIVEELNRVVGELNDIINPIEVYVVNNKNDANLIVTIGPAAWAAQQHSVWRKYDTSGCRGKVVIKGNYSNVLLNTDNIESVEMAKHVLREEITQGLGLINDSMTYPESTFYDAYNNSTEYAPIDRVLIDILYNN